MMSSSLSSWQSANNYRKEGDVVYGVYQGCGFSVSEEDGGKLFIFMLSASDNRAFDTFENALASEEGEISRGQIGDVENYLAVFFDEDSGSISLRTMDSLLEFVAAEARRCGFRVPNTCVKCGAKATKRSFVDNMVQPLCAECSAKQKQNRRPAQAAPAPKPESRNEEDDYESRYAPLKADSSKYDEAYDEYAGMKSQYDDDRYSDKFGGTYNDSDRGNDRISFDDSGDEYREIMGETRRGRDDAPVTEVEGTAGKGILGAALGACIGVIPYLIVSMIADFHMAALCFPAGMLAVVFYTMLHGVRSKGTGMGICMSVSAVISVIFMFLGMVLSYVSDTTNFSAALSYLFDKQLTFFLINVVFSVLGAIFGAFFMISVMNKYVDSGSSRD
ncbi:MAG: hypothetical protein IJM51_04930 [Clostridia bacterium]|nr:hypothetical protein [Clostridia bacterium]